MIFLKERSSGLINKPTCTIVEKKTLFFQPAIHKSGFIHCDVKPSNLAFSEDGLKILDFDMARYKRGAGRYVGTKGYDAPEILMALNWNKSIDIWATGCTIFAILTGNHLFGRTNTLQQLCQTIRTFGEGLSVLFPESSVQSV